MLASRPVRSPSAPGGSGPWRWMICGSATSASAAAPSRPRGV